MAIMMNSGRAALAKAVSAQRIFLAWGTGSQEWDDERPIVDKNDARLFNEVGRKALFRCLFVYPDDEGTIHTDETCRYSVSTEPTRHLCVEFKFDFKDGAGKTIRETGVFIGGETAEGLPPGQSYFTPDQVKDAGTLLMLDHLEKKIERPSAQPCSFTYVLHF